MTTEELLEKSFEVYKPADVIDYWKRGIWGAEEVKEKLEGFIERHDCHKSQDSGCPCDSWRGIISAINEVKTDDEERNWDGRRMCCVNGECTHQE